MCGKYCSLYVMKNVLYSLNSPLWKWEMVQIVQNCGQGKNNLFIAFLQRCIFLLILPPCVWSSRNCLWLCEDFLFLNFRVSWLFFFFKVGHIPIKIECDYPINSQNPRLRKWNPKGTDLEETKSVSQWLQITVLLVVFLET